MRRKIKAAKIHVERTHRGWRYALILGANDCLSCLSYKTEKEAREAAERQRDMMLGMFPL